MEKDPGYEVGIYVITLVAIIMGLFVINWALTFYKLWSRLKERSIAIRRPKSVLLFGILCALSLCIRNPIQFLRSLNSASFNQMHFIQHISLHFTTIAIVYILVYRTWMVYYDIKWNQSLEDAEWQSQINTKTLKQSWYIKHRKSYGDSKYAAIVLSVPWSFLCFCGSVSVFIGGRSTISTLFYIINLFVGIALLSILSCKMPHYNDYFKLRKEVKISCITAITCLIGFIVIGIVLTADIGEWKWIFVQMVHISLLFALSTISYYWVFRQFKLPSNICYLSKYTESTQSASMMSQSSTVNVANTTPKPNELEDIHLIDILKDDELFKLFARHLCKEFAIENLLFFIESHQFVQYMVPLLDKEKKKKKKKDIGIHSINILITNNMEAHNMDSIICSSQVPQSTIVQDLRDNQNEENAMNIAAINIFLKYIDFEDAYFLINISSETRECLREVFGRNHAGTKQEAMSRFLVQNNVTLKQLYDAFNEARAEIFRLLVLSCSRFTSQRHKQYI